MTEAEIDLIIEEVNESERNPPIDDYWQFVTDTEDLRFIRETIRINGSIKIEEY